MKYFNYLVISMIYIYESLLFLTFFRKSVSQRSSAHKNPIQMDTESLGEKALYHLLEYSFILSGSRSDRKTHLFPCIRQKLISTEDGSGQGCGSESGFSQKVGFGTHHPYPITIYTPTICICKGWKVKCQGILLYREDSRLFWCRFCTEESDVQKQQKKRLWTLLLIMLSLRS